MADCYSNMEKQSVFCFGLVSQEKNLCCFRVIKMKIRDFYCRKNTLRHNERIEQHDVAGRKRSLDHEL